MIIRNLSCKNKPHELDFAFGTCDVFINFPLNTGDSSVLYFCAHTLCCFRTIIKRYSMDVKIEL